MQYHCVIHKIIRVFLGKINWEHRAAVGWLWRTTQGGCLNVSIQRSVFAGVCTIARGDGGRGPGECVSHTERTLGVWSDGLAGGHLCFRAEHKSQRAGREAACELHFCLQAVILQDCLAREQTNMEEDWEEPPVQLEGGLSSLLGGKAAH